MKKLILLSCFVFTSMLHSWAQCDVSSMDATSCVCKDGSTECQLLPDIKASKMLLLDPTHNHEYPQTGAGANNGLYRLSVSTPNIGHGPLTVLSTSIVLCGGDTLSSLPVGGCPDGSLPRQQINQRVYYKNADGTMTYTDRFAHFMTYHPTHGHMHVDDWGFYTLRIEDPTEPDTLKWPIVGEGTKQGFCLMDYGTCSFYNGHCVDDSDNVLTTPDFPNFGLGGGSYGCSSVEQGISSGYTDIYYEHLDGMWLTIPPGTCNGDYWLVVEMDPEDHFLEENENNNVVIVPLTLTEQDPPGIGYAKIDVSGSLQICGGESVSLTANAGYPYLWNTGESSRSISVNAPGKYWVEVTTPCGIGYDTVEVIASEPGILSTDDDTIYGSGSAVVSANGIGFMHWYAGPTDPTILAVGNSFTTPLISTTTPYYVQAIDTIFGYLGNNAPHDSTIGTGGYHSPTDKYLLFDAYTDLTLESVKVYAADESDRTIELRDNGGTLIHSLTVHIMPGASRVNLDFDLPMGTGYQLGISGAADLWRSNTGVAYPYTIPGILSITSSSVGAGYYYYYYDWEVSTADKVCENPARSMVYAYVMEEGSGIQASSEEVLLLYPNPAKDRVTIQFAEKWSNAEWQLFNVNGQLVMDGKLSGLSNQSIELQSLIPGNYKIKFSKNDQLLIRDLVIE